MSKSLPYIIIAGLVVYIALMKGCEETKPEVTVEEDIRWEVDSLETVIENIEGKQPDTVYIEKVKVDTVYKDTTEDGQQVNIYESSYSDSLISARWATAVAGTLVNQDFEYVPAPPRIIEKTVTQYLTKTHTITKTIQNPPGNYLGGGLLVGGNQQQFLLAPHLTYHMKGTSYIIVGYDVVSGSPMAGGGVKLSLKNLLPF